MPDQNATVGKLLTITNCASEPEGPVTFSLGPNAPAGAMITTNGIFRWTPTCAQGSSNYVITLVATDNDTPPTSALTNFLVTVPECIQIALGNTALQTGHTGAVALRLTSPTIITNLAFTVLYPPDRFTTNFSLAVNSPEILATNCDVVSPGELRISFSLPSNRALYGPTNVGSLALVATPDRCSGFVWLPIVDVIGLKPDGTQAQNAAGYPGRVAVIGPEPLLGAWMETNHQAMLTLYGNPDSTYLVLCETNATGANWAPGWQVHMTNPTNLFENFPIETRQPQLLYRALKP